MTLANFAGGAFGRSRYSGTTASPNRARRSQAAVWSSSARLTE